MTRLMKNMSQISVLIFCLTAACPLWAQAKLGPGLSESLANMLPTDQMIVIVTFDQSDPVSEDQVDGIETLGVNQGMVYHSLPIMAVLATRYQIEDIQLMHGVRSIWMNEGLVTYTNDARAITGVEKVQSQSFQQETGLHLTGAGSTIVINDSGIDATHEDLLFGDKVVENAQGLTNLNAVLGILPVTYLEGQPTTDTNSGHGTHCAGIAAGTGARSGGLYKGAAPGADLVGYGSGGAIAVLDAIGGFDYAITHQFSFDNPVRVISNSWGTTGPFDPDNPINVASYEAYKRGMVVVFAAGNSGSGENTHNPYAQAPWVISVGAGTKSGTLADFSSRGLNGESGTFTTPDGTTWTYVNEITLTAPGVDVISTRALTNTSSNGGTDDADVLDPSHLPFYTMISGTSMATPHVAGIAALMLEANPSLSPLQVKQFLQETATNMPGLEAWEAGAGYVNACAAVAGALGLHEDFHQTVNTLRDFNSEALLSDAGQLPFSINFSPVGDPDTVTFEVGPDIAWVIAGGNVGDNTVALVLYDPQGNRYGSAISLPIIGEQIGVSAPGVPGTWTVTVRGIGAISGVRVDPLDLTNGIAAPGTVDGTVRFVRTDGYQGLDDVAGHPQAGAIQYAVSRRLVDGDASGNYRPDDSLTRVEMAEYLVMGAGVRQARPFDGGHGFGDVATEATPFVEAVAAEGAALKDLSYAQDPVMPGSGGVFGAQDAVTRLELAYALIQNLGLQDQAQAFSGDVTVDYNDQVLTLADNGDIPAGMRGYVQLALDLGILNAIYTLEQGATDLFPTIYARFHPDHDVTRAHYADFIARYVDSFND